MSTNIDQNIVKATFDNKQFESNISKTMSSLDKFKKVMNFSKSSKSLNDLGDAAGDVNMSGLSKSVQTVSNKFSALGIVGVTTLVNLTNSAVNAGKRMIKALTIDPVKTGLEEYETKMNSIKTILANTAESGTTLEDVNAVLADLNEYSDKTVYNFAQMTDMVGKFSATSGELDSSVSIVKGLANLAAEAGIENSRLQSALYQTSQAMSGAYFMKMDWNSLESAGIATRKFKNDLVEMGKELGAFEGKEQTLIDLENEVIGFGQTLEEGWLTKDVFSAVTSMYALDQSMIDAAGEVTTFTKLFTVMKESVQSGWAISWEKIIGDRDQSVKLLTEISSAFTDIISPGQKARNEMLEFWNTVGGREDVIDGIKNILSSLGRIIGGVSSAFREIFPRTTGFQLVEISIAFRKLTERLAVSDQTLKNITDLFKGLFSVLGLFRDVFVGVLKSMGSFKGLLPAIGSDLASIAGAFGRLLIGFSNMVKQSKVIQKAISGIGYVLYLLGSSIYKLVTNINIDFDKIGETVTRVSDRVSVAIGYLINLLGSYVNKAKELGKIKWDSLEELKEKIPTISDVLASVIERIDKLKGILGSIKDRFANAFGKIGDIVEAFKGKFEEIFNRKLEKQDIFEAGAITGVVVLLSKLWKIFNTFMTLRADLQKSFTGMMDSVAGTFEAFQNRIKADNIKTIAISIGILAASLIAISAINKDKLAGTMGAMAGLMVGLFGSAGVLTKLGESKGFASVEKINTSLLVMAVSMNILAGAMSKLSGLDVGQIAAGTAAISTMMVVLTSASFVFSKIQGNMISTSAGILLLSFAMAKMVKVLSEMGALPWEVIKKGLIGVGALFVELVTFMMLGDKFGGMGISAGLGMLAMSKGVLYLGDAVSKFGEMDTDVLIQGMLAMMGTLLSLGVFSRLAGMATNMIATSVGLIIISKALDMFIDVIESMAEIDVNILNAGLIAMAKTLGLVAVAVLLIPNKVLLISAGLVVLAQALSMFAGVISKLGAIDTEIIKKAFLTLAAGLGLLLVAGLALSPVMPILIALAAVMGTLSLGLVAAGVGITMFAAGLAALAAGGAAGVLAITATIGAVIELIPKAFTMLASGLIKFATIIQAGTPQIMSTIKGLILGILGVVKAVVPEIAKTVYGAMVAILTVIADHIPDIIKQGARIVMALLTGIANNISGIVKKAIDVVLAFIAGVRDKIPEVVQAAIDLMLAYINGMANAIDKNTQPVIDAIDNLMRAFRDAAIKVLVVSVKRFWRTAKDIINAIIYGMKEVVPEVLSTLGDMGERMLDAIYNLLPAWTQSGLDLIGGFIGGIKDAIPNAIGAVKDIGGAAIDGLKEKLNINSPSKVGQWLGNMFGEGFGGGITDLKDKVLGSGKVLGGSATDGVKSGFDPYAMSDVSKELAKNSDAEKTGEEIGEELASGVGSGIQNGSGSATNAAKDLSKEAFDAAVEAIDERKYYNQITLEEELSEWNKLQNAYAKGTDERKKADREAYRVRKEIRDAEFQHSLDWIQERKDFNELSLEEELAAWKRVQARYYKGTDERKKADKELYRVKNELADQAYQNEIDWIQERKDFNQLSLGEELQAWQRIQSKYEEGTEKRKRADKEVYDLKKTLREKEEQLDADYLSKSKSINKELSDDIKRLNQEYENAVDSRANSIYNSYGLFDKVDESEEIDGKVLAKNLEAQIASLEEWETQLGELSAKGVDEGLVGELEKMGPKSLDQIKALNSLTAPELDSYGEMWKTKHSMAREKAVSELEQMRVETNSKISQLKSDANRELRKLKKTWEENVAALTARTSVQVDELTNDVETETKEMRKETETQFQTLLSNVGDLDWKGLGENIVNGIISGVGSRSGALSRVVRRAASNALEAAKDELDIHSPSRKFYNVGANTISGFINAITDLQSNVRDAGSNIGRSAVESIKEAVSLKDIFENGIDDPVIRPIMDLSRIKRSVDEANRMLNSEYGNPTLRPKDYTVEGQNGSKDLTAAKQSQYNFNQYNYSPKALSRIEIYRQTNNQLKAVSI